MGSTSYLLRCVRSFSQTLEEAALADADLLRRFVRNQDSAAFSALLARHGPMVLGVCQRTLQSPAEMEDAFQATFLVLIRKAATLRQPDRLGPWLYGVALRISRKLRSQTRLGLAVVPEVIDPASVEDSDRDAVRGMVDEAIHHLPAKYRESIVLCYLQGLTNQEAANQLGCPIGTIAIRLSRAREQLRRRLTRRGLAVSAAGLLSSLEALAFESVVPTSLSRMTIRLADTLSVPARVALLGEGVLRSMILEKWRWMVSTITVLAFMAAGSSLIVQSNAEDPRPVTSPTIPVPAPAEAAPVPVPVVEPAREVEKPTTVRTKNFTVQAPSARIAKLVAKTAEQHRIDFAKLWLGRELPDWKRPCPVQVTIELTGSSGATTMTFPESDVELQMQVKGSLERILANVLPHEVTHTVMATHFLKPLPRWVDEGISLLSEDEDEQVHHHHLMKKLLDEHRAMPMGKLFVMKHYPQDVMAFFAQGFSVTDFLVKKKDRKTLLEFVKHGMETSWDKAVKEHYGYENVNALEEAWLASFKKSAEATAKKDKEIGSKITPPSSAAPMTALAYYDAKQKRFMVYQLSTSVQPITEYIQVTEGKQTVMVPITTLRQRTEFVPLICDVDKMEVHDSEGKKIDKECLTRLDKPTVVLLSSDGKKVDPFYLGIIKPGTLVLTQVIPMGGPAFPTAVAPATAPVPAVPPSR